MASVAIDESLVDKDNFEIAMTAATVFLDFSSSRIMSNMLDKVAVSGLATSKQSSSIGVVVYTVFLTGGKSKTNLLGSVPGVYQKGCGTTSAVVSTICCCAGF